MKPVNSFTTMLPQGKYSNSTVMLTRSFNPFHAAWFDFVAHRASGWDVPARFRPFSELKEKQRWRTSITNAIRAEEAAVAAQMKEGKDAE